MKRIISLILVLLMATSLFVLTACGDKTIKIGVQIGSIAENYVNGDSALDFEGLDGYEAVGYANGGLAVNDMKNGTVKYVITDKASATQLQNTIPGIKVIGIELTEEEYAFGVDEAQPELLGGINKVLEEKNDEVKAIIDKYAKGEDIVPIASAKKDPTKADKQLVVATTASFAPFEYTVDDKFAGIDIEIMKLVADTLGLELVIENMSFENVLASVGKDYVDVAAAGISVTDERKGMVDFSTSYYESSQVLVVLDSDKTFDECRTEKEIIEKLEKLK